MTTSSGDKIAPNFSVGGHTVEELCVSTASIHLSEFLIFACLHMCLILDADTSGNVYADGVFMILVLVPLGSLTMKDVDSDDDELPYSDLL